MSILDTVKKSFSALHTHIKFVVVLFGINLTMNLLTLPFAPRGPQALTDPAAAGSLTLLGILFIFVGVFIQGGTFGSARDIVKTNSFDPKKFINYGKTYYLRLLAVGAIVLGVIFAAIIGVAIIIGIAAVINIAFLTPVLTLIGIAVALAALYLVFLIFLAPYIVVTEDAGIVESIKKSINIVGEGVNLFVGPICLVFSPIIAILYLFPNFRSSKFGQTTFVKLIVMTILLILIGFGIGLVMGAIVGLLTVILRGILGRIIMSVFNSVLNSYLGILMTLAYTAYYLAIAKPAAPAANTATPFQGGAE